MESDTADDRTGGLFLASVQEASVMTKDTEVMPPTGYIHDSFVKYHRDPSMQINSIVDEPLSHSISLIALLNYSSL
jgi:hypothetical protein